MRKVTINEYEFSIPERWNELTDAELLAVAALIDAKESHGTIGLELLLGRAPFTVVSKNRKFEKGHQCYALKHKHNNDAADILIPLLSLTHLVQNGFKWLFTDEYNPDAKDFIFKVTSTLTRSPFEGDKNFPYIGPKDGVSNITFDEYIVANTMLDAYAKDGTDANLNRFCATLWRPKRKGTAEELLRYGDAREEFNDFVIDEQAKDWTKVDRAHKLVILWYYLGSMNELRRFKALQGKASKSNEPVYMASAKLVDAIANGDVTKNKEVRRTYLYEVLIHLDRVQEANDAMEERASKAAFKNKK